MGEKPMVEGSLAKKQPRVIVIEADKELRPKKLRVAAYARVSSDSTDQLNSFMAQVRYYTTYITSKEEWVFVDLYADEGITGTSAEKRTEFQRLIADCKRGLIDKVLCKSISRFARNTTDCLETIRLLKGLGVGVCFEEQNIDTAQMSGELLTAVFAAILKSEKYCGDVLLQKTFISDCISRKVIKNVGQLPMYLIQDHHEGIVRRETYQAAQAEFARRSSRRSPNKRAAATGLSSYTSRYALSDRLVCGECGTLYRRCTWVRKGGKKIVWRCSSRLDYGSKYCKDSPTMEEGPLQQAILRALNSVMGPKEVLIERIGNAIRQEMTPKMDDFQTLTEIDRSLEELQGRFQALLEEVQECGGDVMSYQEEFTAINEQMTTLQTRRVQLLEAQQADLAITGRLQEAESLLAGTPSEITEWDEALVRQTVETVKVLSAHEILVCLKDGTEIRETVL